MTHLPDLRRTISETFDVSPACDFAIELRPGESLTEVRYVLRDEDGNQRGSSVTVDPAGVSAELAARHAAAVAELRAVHLEIVAADFVARYPG